MVRVDGVGSNWGVSNGGVGVGEMVKVVECEDKSEEENGEYENWGIGVDG